MELTFALEDLEFSWSEMEVAQVIKMWERGTHIHDIADAVRYTSPEARRYDETAVVIMHLKRQGLISDRSGGYIGGEAK